MAWGRPFQPGSPRPPGAGIPKGAMQKKTREKLRAVLRSAQATAENTIEQLARGAFYDMRRLFDDQGNIKPLHELSEADAAMIGGFEIVLKNAAAGDGVIDRVLKVKLVDRSKYVEMLAKYHKLLVERVEFGADDDLIALLDRRRDALAAATREALPEAALEGVVVPPRGAGGTNGSGGT